MNQETSEIQYNGKDFIGGKKGDFLNAVLLRLGCKINNNETNDDDKFFKITKDDKTAGYFTDKIKEGANVKFTKTTVDGVETITISVDITTGGSSNPIIALIANALTTANKTASNGINETTPKVFKLGGELTMDTFIDTKDFNFVSIKETTLNILTAAFTSIIKIKGHSGTATPEMFSTAYRAAVSLEHTSNQVVDAISLVTCLNGDFAFDSAFNYNGGFVACLSTNAGFSNIGNLEFMAGILVLPPRHAKGKPAYLGTIQNWYGIRIVDSKLSSDIADKIVNRWGIYQEGPEDVNYFANKLTFATTTVAPGTTGAQVINKPTGTCNIAAGETNVTITNSYVKADSIIIAIAGTNDTTGYVKNVVTSNGSFIINLVAAATSEIKLKFVVYN